MITDDQTNKVYFSERLTWSTCWNELSRLLTKNKVPYELLKGTKDKWVRDYMPIQIEKDKFVSYVYNPDYLQSEEDRKSITDWQKISNLPSMENVVPTRLIIDGGNVIRCSDKVIMTDKVFLENRRLQYSRMEVMEELERLFGKVVIIPWDRQDEWDFCGHADGMIRYIGDNCVLINNICNHPENTWQLKEIKEILHRNHIEYEELDYGEGKHGVNDWAYLNFLQVGDKIFMPTVEKHEVDQKAEHQLEHIYNCEVIPVPFLPIVKANGKYGGGALNCVSWNIYQ